MVNYKKMTKNQLISENIKLGSKAEDYNNLQNKGFELASQITQLIDEKVELTESEGRAWDANKRLHKQIQETECLTEIKLTDLNNKLNESNAIIVKLLQKGNVL